MIDRQLAPEPSALREELGLAPVRHVFGGNIHSPQLVIGLFPEWFAPLQPDWPQNLHLTGFVLYDASAHVETFLQAEEFLSAGPAPVLFTPGSGAATLHGFLCESVEGCRRTGMRAMLVANFLEQVPKDLPRHVRAFSYLPFSRILPRCSAMVYPGGSAHWRRRFRRVYRIWWCRTRTTNRTTQRAWSGLVWESAFTRKSIAAKK